MHDKHQAQAQRPKPRMSSMRQSTRPEIYTESFRERPHPITRFKHNIRLLVPAKARLCSYVFNIENRNTLPNDCGGWLSENMRWALLTDLKKLTEVTVKNQLRFVLEISSTSMKQRCSFQRTINLICPQKEPLIRSIRSISSVQTNQLPNRPVVFWGLGRLCQTRFFTSLSGREE